MSLETATIAYKNRGKVFIGTLENSKTDPSKVIINGFKELVRIETNSLSEEKLYVVMSDNSETQPKIFVLDEFPLAGSSGETVTTDKLEEDFLVAASNLFLHSFKNSTTIH